MKKQVKCDELFDIKTPYLTELFENSTYPWEILPKITDYINKLIEQGIPGYRLVQRGVLVGENVKIYSTAIIEGPTILGSGTVVRPGAYIRGSVICGENCVIGNSSEVKNSILLDNVQVPHYNYVGDSILGNRSHLGAGSVLSNLKADKKNVVIHSDGEYETNLRKVGAFLGDNCEIGCGCILNPGTIVGKNTSVYPKNSLRGVYICNSIVKNENEIIQRV